MNVNNSDLTVYHFTITTSVLNQLKRNFHFRDRHIFVNLYKQHVRPHLEFSSQAWSPWLVGDIEVIEKVQEKAVRIERDHLRGKVRRAGTGNPEKQKRTTGHGLGTQVRDE
jgi:hypothetical protein